MGDDELFKALADPTRRALLDRLRERNGQTLGELCGPLEMARQSATQHLGVLEAANLITTVRRGREKLHYLNPVPLWDIQERWIEKFERPRLRALSAIRRRAEEGTMDDRPSYVYVTYVESSPERVWEALTDPELTARYWGHSNVSDWQAGSRWEHRRVDGSGIADVIGTVLEAVPPRRLTMTFDAPGEAPAGGPSTVTFDIEPYHEIVRLTVTHENLADEQARQAVSAGWPAVCANLKSLLETGHVLPRAPWEMHAGQRAAQMDRSDPGSSLARSCHRSEPRGRHGPARTRKESSMTMPQQLTKPPSVNVGMLIRRPPHEVFEALADPSVTTRFWYTKSTGRMAEGAELTWVWEMYGASGKVRVKAVQADRSIRFSWDGYDPAHPTTVEFQFTPQQNDTTYLRITETGFTGDADTQVSRALDSTGGFTFLLSSLKAALEHDITLRTTMDAHPPNLHLPSR